MATIMTPIEEKAQAFAESQIDGMEFANEYERQCALNNYKYAYLQGSNDILSLPLSERLTEEEKEKIRAKYNEVKELSLAIGDNEMFAGDEAVFEWLFGSDFLEEGGNDE